MGTRLDAENHEAVPLGGAWLEAGQKPGSRNFARERLKERRGTTLVYTLTFLLWDPRVDPDSLDEVVGPTSVRLVTRTANTKTRLGRLSRRLRSLRSPTPQLPRAARDPIPGF